VVPLGVLVRIQSWAQAKNRNALALRFCFFKNNRELVQTVGRKKQIKRSEASLVFGFSN
jgi:hypothetical protein